MLTADEIRPGMSAAWLLFLDRTEGLRLLDFTFRGFWRSFLVIVLLAPVYVLYVMAERVSILAELPAGVELGETAFLLSRIVALLLDWAAFPLVAAAIAGPLGFAHRYVPLIVAYNWSAPLIVVPLTLPAILLAGGLVSQGVAVFLMLIAIAHAIRYRFVVARRVLDGNLPLAIGLVTLEVVLSLFLSQVMTRVSGV